MNLHRIADQLEKRLGLSHVKPIHVIARAGYTHERIRTHYQALLNGRKIFVKRTVGKGKKKGKNEFDFCNQLRRINADNFPEALFCTKGEDCCIAFDFLEGETLSNKIQSADFSPSERKSVILQLKDVAKSLIEVGIVHDDMHSSNFVVTKDGTLKLIDFGSAVDRKRYEKRYAACKNPALLFPLLVNRIAGRDHSNDLIEMLNILERIGCQESYQETYREVEVFLKEHIGEWSFRRNIRQFLRFFRVPGKLEHRVKHIVRPFLYRIGRRS